MRAGAQGMRPIADSGGPLVVSGVAAEGMCALAVAAGQGVQRLA
jgi:hypothetical protein